MDIRQHRVKHGENLSTISSLYYGTPKHALVIFQHNRHYIEDPNSVYPGQVLAIPYIHVPVLSHDVIER